MINVSADPQSVPAGGKSTITATVRSSSGTRLPDQEVIFSTTAGKLTPSAQTALTTDDNGQATSVLTNSSNNTATVTARSGTITATTTVNFTSCALDDIILTLNPQVLPSCNTDVMITVTLLDTNGDGCPGERVTLSKKVPTGSFNELVGNFLRSQGTTDSNGEFTTTFQPDQNSCNNNCDLNFNPMAPNSGDCRLEITADGGGLSSFPETLTESL